MISPRKTSGAAFSEPSAAASPGSARGKSRSRDSEKKRRKKKPKGNLAEMEFVAPDGGWGWVVVAASGLSSFSILPLGQNFGLIYKEKYEEWGITQAEYSFMRNIEFAISSSMGLISGGFLRKYGYRKMSLLGGSLCALSYLITSQISSISNFTLFFSILGGIGSGIAWPANALALNTYFKLRRGIATGLSWTATGLSPVIMPQLITLLMGYTDVHGTVLILAGITLHCIPMALLLQPAHWHGRWVHKGDPAAAAPAKAPLDEEQKAFLEVPGVGGSHDRLNDRRASLKRGQVEGIDEEGDYIMDTQSTLGLDVAAPISRQSSVWSLVSAKSRPCVHDRLCEDCHRACEDTIPEITVTEDEEKPPADEGSYAVGEGDERKNKKRPFWKRALSTIVDFFDLTLLKDPKFVSIFIGMTLGFVAEVNFALLVPFIYAEFGFTKDVVALCMSMLAGMDLVTRFTVPFITDRYRMDCRLMYSIGLLILSTGRIGLAHLSGFKTIMAVTLWLGFGKGLRTVFMALVIPSYVPLHRLPMASGLQMMANGIIFIIIGPLFGYLRDSSENYTASLHCLNALNFSMLALWSVEYLVERFCRGRRKGKSEDVT